MLPSSIYTAARHSKTHCLQTVLPLVFSCLVFYSTLFSQAFVLNYCEIVNTSFCDIAPIMACLNNIRKEVSTKKIVREEEVYTLDGAVDRHGHPAIRGRTGTWITGILLLVNQGLATLAFFGVGVNLVLFLTRVLGQDNADAANNVSKWTGTVYIFSLLGAFLSDSYWGRYKTCAIFQAVFVVGLVLLSISSSVFLLKPSGCGDEDTPCGSHSAFHILFFYLAIYLVGLGNGGYQPNIATFGSDQFDEEDPKERHSKIAFFSYFYLALNLGSLFSNTILGYFEDQGMWTLGFWASTGCAFMALVLFLIGTPRYRHFKPKGNPLSRFCQVLVAATRKWKVEMTPGGEHLFELDKMESAMNGARKILHTEGFRFLDRAAIMTPTDYAKQEKNIDDRNQWRLCTVTQVEEVKCILRLLPIWLCTILYSVVFAQMASLFVEQGAAMKTTISNFRIPAASMSSFDILSVAIFIFIYRRLLDPIVSRIKTKPKGLTELQRMGIGLFIAILAMVSAGLVELFRLKHANKDCPSCKNASSLSIFWQIPQYMLIGASEVFMYVGQLEFFNGQAPDGLKSFGSALCMASISLGNYVSSLLVIIVMKISTRDDMPGWIPENLNRGHMDRFYFLLAALTTADLVVYIICTKRYKYIKFEGRSREDHNSIDGGQAAAAAAAGELRV
ncbi:protein NRT1/ PTR FAMILY 7.2-like [Durio zibethinus]|uniref:Protein NRT1/ PTR FAMILY 7.2-like n=1 Tax=Durio zibethinus TaxID=66656 RepID=A0A6P5WZ11_DURZI|nr:protein NRT1/ PTR FAMILY 7.2-like [Durio zibethinus]